LVDHISEGWLKKLADIYQEIEIFIYKPKAIPITQFGITDADLGLSQWHVMIDFKTHSTSDIGYCLEVMLYNAPFVAKEVGNYKSARQHAWDALS